MGISSIGLVVAVTIGSGVETNGASVGGVEADSPTGPAAGEIDGAEVAVASTTNFVGLTLVVSRAYLDALAAGATATM